MKALWIAFIVLATLGSIYPFNFQFNAVDGSTISAFVQSCCRMPGRGDLVGNIILFAPIGFTGMFAIAVDKPWLKRLSQVCLVAALVALALQLAQIFLPTRDENLQDVLWNTAGAVSGAVLAMFISRVALTPRHDLARLSLIPVALIAAWICYRLIPFVPSLDFQLIKDSLKPLFSADISVIGIVHDFAAWLVVAYLLHVAQTQSRLDRYLPALIGAVFFLEVLIVDNSVSLSNVIGATTAMIFWFALAVRAHALESCIAFVLIGSLLLIGLLPLVLTADPAPFAWLPFRGFLGGSMYVNAQSATGKVFLYGSLVYLLWRTGLHRVTGVAIALVLISSIEFLQRSIVGHTAEITDPVLVLLAAYALIALERHEKSYSPAILNDATAVDNPGSEDAAAKNSQSAELAVTTDVGNLPRIQCRLWHRQNVNFRRSQYDVLVRLADELRLSVSGVTRKIVSEFMAGLDEGEAAPAWVNGGDPTITGRFDLIDGLSSAATDSKWVRQTINLRRSQFDFLQQLAQESGMSVSGITREIVVLFIGSSATSKVGGRVL